MEDRDAIYRRQAEEAAKQIASWPRWMQRNLAPTKQSLGDKKASKASGSAKG
jgi:hypothetical protein